MLNNFKGQEALKTKLKVKKVLVDAGHRNYWENEKLVDFLCSKEFINFFNNSDYIYNSMEKLGCFKNLKGHKKYYEYKTAWQDWLKYKKPIPKHITPVRFNNLIGGYGTYNKIKKV
jgi:hypothetical protein